MMLSVRKPAVAGSFYPASAKEIRTMAAGWEMARSAAFSDPRFPSLSRSEAPRVEIEVSVLSPLKRIASVDEFKLGRDGIYIIKGSRHGTFLPQVAAETGWKDAELYTYQTEVVEEPAL